MTAAMMAMDDEFRKRKKEFAAKKIEDAKKRKQRNAEWRKKYPLNQDKKRKKLTPKQKAKKHRIKVKKELKIAPISYKKFKIGTCKFRQFGYLDHFATSPKERQIENILSQMDVRFYREVTFDDNKRFDFYLFDYDIVIEYDGRQHFETLKQIKNDNHKDGILSKNNIKCFRYNFTHKDLKRSVESDLRIYKQLGI